MQMLGNLMEALAGTGTRPAASRKRLTKLPSNLHLTSSASGAMVSKERPVQIHSKHGTRSFKRQLESAALRIRTRVGLSESAVFPEP